MKSFLLACAVALPTLANAGTCALDEEITKVQWSTVERNGRLAEAAMPLLQGIKRVSEHAKLPGKPVGDQLTPAQLAEFSELRQRLMANQLSQFIESKRERDMKVVRTMVIESDSYYRWGQVHQSNDTEIISVAALAILQEKLPDVKITEPSEPACNVERAIFEIELAEAQLLLTNDSAVVAATREIEGIRMKYGATAKRENLSQADRDRVDQLERVSRPSQKAREHVMNLERIRLMAKTSDALYEAAKEDAAISGGDMNAVGRTIQARLARNELGPHGDALVALWDRINEKLPSELIRQMSKISGASQPKGAAGAK